MKRDPEISVIIASYNARRTIEACLTSLREQRTNRVFEVIMVDSGSDGTDRLVAQRFPEVRLHHEPTRAFCGSARNIGLRLARGGIIAFIDADCVADRDWIEGIAAAHREPWVGIGGGIANGNPQSYVGWAAYFCEFSQWLPGQRRQLMDDVPGANASYKREVFERFGDFIEGTYCSDTEFNWRLGRAGLRLMYTPTIRIAHSNIDRLTRYLWHEFFHGRSFGRVRIRARRFSVRRRAAYVLLSPLVLGKLVLHRTVKSCTTRACLAPFIKAFPLFTLGVACWTLGEAAGYSGL